VEDETFLREVAADLLGRLGFEVLEARDGRKAIEVFEANRVRIRLVLLDLVMPRMDGEEAYRELRRLGARMPVILCSGFDPQEALRRFTGTGLAGFLQKPYRFQALAERVRGALEADQSGPDACETRSMDWSPAFATGHPVLDGQHRQILAGFNRVLAAIHGNARGDAGEDAGGDAGEGAGGGAGGDALDAALQAFIGELEDHFAAEEDLMAESGDPAIGGHKAVHGVLKEQVRAMAAALRDGRLKLNPSFLNSIRSLVFCHHLHEDRQLAGHLKSAGL
jgi:hemerythrin-like metal-binding protein